MSCTVGGTSFPSISQRPAHDSTSVRSYIASFLLPFLTETYACAARADLSPEHAASS